MVVGHGKKLRAWLYVYVYYKVRRRVLHIIKTTDWKKKIGTNGRSTGARHFNSIVPVCFERYLTLFFSFLFLSSTVFLCSTRRDEETDRDDAASNASRLVILEAQVLLRILHCSRAHRRSRAETHPRHRSNGYGDTPFLSLFCFITIFYIFPLDLIIISWYWKSKWNTEQNIYVCMMTFPP
jgi:hypothetical protein